MSVVVNGMRIPENCWECVKTDLNIAVSVFGGMCPFCEKIRTDHDMQTGRHPECPLGAMPDKHGRLVDADELKTAFPCCDNNMSIKIASVRATINRMDTIVEAEDET